MQCRPRRRGQYTRLHSIHLGAYSSRTTTSCIDIICIGVGDMRLSSTPIGTDIQDLGCELRRIPLPRNRVNKPCKREQVAHGEGIRVVYLACLVADHGRLSHVRVGGQLREHKGRNIRTRYRLRCVRTPEINTVFALGRFVGESRRTHDYPIEVALFDRLFLALLVVVDVLHDERPNDPIVEETDVTLAVTDSDAGYADQAAHPMLVHRADEVVRTLREKGCATRAARPQRREHSVLAGYGRLYRGRV